MSDRLFKMMAEEPIEYRLDVEDNKVYLHGKIGQKDEKSPWTGEVTQVINAKRVREAVSSIEDDTVEIHINSYGGDVFEGVSIYNYLNNHSKNIEVYVDGVAASAGALIAMAGSKISIGDNAMMMIHRASSFAYGNVDELTKVIDTLRKIDKAVLKSFVNRFKGTEEELMKHLEDEYWMTSDEAVINGFADEITPAKKPKTEVVEKVEESTREVVNRGLMFATNFAKLEIE